MLICFLLIYISQYFPSFPVSQFLLPNSPTLRFEACDARLAFPCWDEPSAKATFTVEMEYPAELICLSNMPPVKESQNGKLKTVLFDKSPKMSTYLLAWVVGEFEYIEAKTSRDVVMRIYTEIGKKDQAQYALKIAVKCLDFYEKYVANYLHVISHMECLRGITAKFIWNIPVSLSLPLALWLGTLVSIIHCQNKI